MVEVMGIVMEVVDMVIPTVVVDMVIPTPEGKIIINTYLLRAYLYQVPPMQLLHHQNLDTITSTMPMGKRRNNHLLQLK